MCGRCERPQEATAGEEELGKRGHLGDEDRVTGSRSRRPRNLAFILSEMISHWKCLNRSVA